MSNTEPLPPWQRNQDSTPADTAPRPWGVVSAILAVIALIAVVVAVAAVNSQRTSSDAQPKAGEEQLVSHDTLGNIPMVSGGDDVLGDSTRFSDTPPVVPTDQQCGTLTSWKNLRDCVEGNNWQWYIDGVNRYAPQTGFDWNDVRDWADKAASYDVRVIGIFNWVGKTDQQARDDVRHLVGDAADDMKIVRHDCITNTRGLEKNTLSPFVDCKRQVRVFLAPLQFKDGGKTNELAGWRGDAGVFVDCYNLWWLGRIITPPTTHAAPPPSGGGTPPPVITTPPVTTTQPPPVTTTVPPPVTTTTVPPVTTTPPAPKDPSQDPGPRGNAPQGSGPNEDPGPGEFIPRDQMEDPPETPRVNPPAPAPTWEPPQSGGPTPEPTTQAPPPPDPGVNGTPGTPGTDGDSSDGVVVEDP